MTERPIDIWNEMTTTARATGRCMFCECTVSPSSTGKRPVICTSSGCHRAYHKMYRHLVRNPRERNEPAEVARVPPEELRARKAAADRERLKNLPSDARERLRTYKRDWARNKRDRTRAGAAQEAASD